MDSTHLVKTSIRFLKRSNTTCFIDPVIPPSKTDFVISTLATKERSQLQTDLLKEYMKNIKIFTELDEEARGKCVQFMVYQRCQGGEVSGMQFVFHQGDEGSRFYVILTGSVAVLRVTRRRDGKTEYTLLTIMRAGDSFGELALINNQPRAASILCREPSQFAVLERDAYKRILCKIDDAKLEAKVKLLQKHPAFSCCTKSALQKVSYFFNEHTYRRKQVVFKAGQDATFVYLIKSGEFELMADMQLHKKTMSIGCHNLRHQQEVTLVSIGEIIGDSEVLGCQPYQYTCVCFSAQGELLQILRDDFLNRVANEQSVETFKRLNFVKEKCRSERIKRASNIEALFGSTGKEGYSTEEVRKDWETERTLGAKQKLEKAVVERWGQPLRRSSGTAKGLRAPIKVVHSPKSMCEERTNLTTAVSSPRSWVDLVEWKYFHNHKSSGIFLHQLKEPSQNMTPRYGKGNRSALYTRHSGKSTIGSHSSLQMEQSS